jgi:hypothetical protein
VAQESRPTLTLRRANVSRKGGFWDETDCIFLQASGAWFWGVSFQLTGRKSYGHVSTLEEAKAAFRAEYERWKGPESDPAG